jgi:ABC-2 type transport system permease protein
MTISAKQDGPFPVYKMIRQLGALIRADLCKLRRDPTEIFTRTIQPTIWLVIYGQAMAKAKTIATGSLPYLDYVAPGITAQSILFIVIFYGLSLIIEKDLGSLHKIMVTPTPRSILVGARACVAGLRGLSQVVVVYLLCLLLDVHLRFDFWALCGVVAVSFLLGAIFSTFSLAVAALLKKRERFIGMGQTLTMPLFFASNALYPIDMMPTWIKALSLVNPLTYQVDALRALMIEGAHSHFGLSVDFAVGLVTFFLLVMLATKLYPKVLY